MSMAIIRDLDALKRSLAPHLTQAKKAIVFGSAARGDADEWSDLGFAEIGTREGYHAQACFMCQQAAAKALKALHYLGGERLVIGHSLLELLRALLTQHPALADLEESARRLDQYYVPTRYPNG